MNSGSDAPSDFRSDWLIGPARLMPTSHHGARMNSQSKRDLIASGAILLMFLGAFMLSFSSSALLLIGAGALLILALIVKAVREQR